MDFVKKRVSLCFCLLSSRDSHPISVYRLFNETSLVVPVAMSCTVVREKQT